MKWIAVQPLIGGMPLGFAEAIGNKPEFIVSYPGIKNDQHITNYWPDVPYFLIGDDGDIIPIQREAFDKLNVGIEIAAAVPICSGLSALNSCNSSTSSKARGADACQNQNMYNISKFILEKIDPKVICAENAPGLYSSMGDRVRTNLHDIATEHGRSISFLKTSCIYHGIPQNRTRTFFFMWKSETAPILEYYHRDHVSLKEYLDQIPVDANHQDVKDQTDRLQKDISFHFMKEVWGDKDFRVIYDEGYRSAMQWIVEHGHLDDAIKFAEKAGHEQGVKFFSHAKKKLDMGKNFWDDSIHIFVDEINAVVGRNMECAIHPRFDRYLTTRELMHLMGLPHDFDLANEKWRNHIAQNVPTAVARDAAFEAIKFINGELVDSHVKMLMQDNTKKKTEITKPINTTSNSLESFF